MNLAIIGSTGFLGRQALIVIKKLKKDFNIFALACEKNIKLLAQQAKEYKPRYLVVYDANQYKNFKNNFFFSGVKIVGNEDGLLEIVSHPEVDGVLFLASGTDSLNALILTIKKRKKIALASKELIVAFGQFIFYLAKKEKVEILPIDSELVAFHLLLNQYGNNEVKKFFLTASGGAIFNYQKNLNQITVKEVLSHPIWKMGKKITVDSATLINKIFEIVEVSHFFDTEIKKIDILIHPQGIIHGLIENNNGIVYGMFSEPDMKIFISYALLKMINKDYDFLDKRLKNFPFNLNLLKPNKKLFPALKLLKYLEKNSSTPAVLVGADEIAVENFLKGKLKFREIVKLIEKTLKAHKKIYNPNLNQLIQAKNWAKRYAQELITNKRL
uniref:1-deoxy-D-xylulose 5-phosphate reductoisomerase n=1 Tax=candidate division WOR-3 bacterium TaxID=2052148 RepID=A0A7V3ZUS9_UNCW3